ncbi:MAG: hypothetical protein K9J30_00235 [Bacteroidales bacterium]|nr:hypothetical protein [Bacteroidales bacterium]
MSGPSAGSGTGGLGCEVGRSSLSRSVPDNKDRFLSEEVSSAEPRGRTRGNNSDLFLSV